MPASANFLKFKVCSTDFDNAISSKQDVALGSNINGVTIGEESAAGGTLRDSARTKKFEGKFGRRRWRRDRRDKIRIPRFWDSDNFSGGRRWQVAAEDVANCRAIFSIPSGLNAITMNPGALCSHGLIGHLKRGCARGPQLGVSVEIPDSSGDKQQYRKDHGFDFGFFLQAPALK
jgi:hypothetical protein